MSKRKRSGAEAVEHSQHGQAGADRVARLHRDHAANQALLVGRGKICKEKTLNCEFIYSKVHKAGVMLPYFSDRDNL